MLQVYWKNATDEIIDADHGITEEDRREIGRPITAAHEAVLKQIARGELGYAKLTPPKDNPRQAQAVQEVKDLVQHYRDEKITDLVLLGIGGSALGNIALQSALNPCTYNYDDTVRRGPRMFALDNVDPALVGEVLSHLERTGRLATTVVNVVSKSGDTAETTGQFMVFCDALRRCVGERHSDHIVATCGYPYPDPKTGEAVVPMLYAIAEREGYRTLEQFHDVGGRFSVLSAGLFTAAMCGIDIDALLAGAAEMKRRVETPLDHTPWTGNPACVLAAVKYLAFAKKDKAIHVMMPYSDRLYLLADWYRQLWAESLGKRVDRQGKEVFVGPTPIKALGTTDQHSQVQLYREGPNDKLIVFVEATRHPREVEIPEVFRELPGLSYLCNQPLGRLLHAEKVATEYAMSISDRPTVTIRLDEINPQNIGAFMYLYEFATSLMGELLNINAYNQPAVELGKQATFALMGRQGYEEFARAIREFMHVDEDFCA